jgi:hypothetical protein
MMKKIVALSMLFAFAAGSALGAIHFEAGIRAGTRTVSDAAIKSVYGNGTVYYPYVAVHPWKGLFVGVGYEGGYSRSGTIGLYGEPTTLSVTGFEVFAGYEIMFGTVAPFIKAGYGSYSCKQTVDSPYVADYEVDTVKGALVIGGGLKIFVSDKFFLSGEARLVPLKIKPYDTEVDIGGMRYTAGIGVKF